MQGLSTTHGFAREALRVHALSLATVDAIEEWAVYRPPVMPLEQTCVMRGT